MSTGQLAQLRLSGTVQKETEKVTVVFTDYKILIKQGFVLMAVLRRR
jgi:hypothetical protein